MQHPITVLGAQGDERAVLQPKADAVCNLQESKAKLMKKQQSLESRHSLTYPSKNSVPKSLPISPGHNHYKPKAAASAILSKRANVNDPHSLNLSTDRQCISIKPSSSSPRLIRDRKKFRNSCVHGGGRNAQASCNDRDQHSASSLQIKNPATPGSIAAARREQVNLLQVQRKQRIAHYGRTPKSGAGKVVTEEPETPTGQTTTQEHKRCNFITPNSDPIYVRYHDEEWGVPVHDDKLLFELLVLAGFQVGMDWTTILKMRNDFREAFEGFDAELVANFNERRIASISAQLRMDVNRVRSVIDNSKRVIEIKDEFGSLDKYVWGFLNCKAMSPEYRSCRKIPVKTSKSESISKEMVRRKLRNVGPTVIHSFMQAAGLTNDHVLTCPRHAHCLSVATAINPATNSSNNS